MSEEGSSAGQPVEVAVLVEGGSQSVQLEAPLQPPLSAFTEPTELPAAASDAPSTDGTSLPIAEGRLPPKSRAKGGRGRGGKGRSNLGKRKAASEAGEESQTPEEERPLARRTSKRERTKPQAYSPTNQDKETKLRRQALKLQEREGSQALSEDVSEPRRPPPPARKVVKEEEAPEKDSSDEDQPLKLTRRSVSVATSELPAARPAAGPSAANLPSADGDGSSQEARQPPASTVIEPDAMPVEPNLPEPENAKTAEAQPLQTTKEQPPPAEASEAQPPQAQATEAQPPPAAAAQPLQAAEAHPVASEADLPPAAEPQQTLAAGMGQAHTASRPAAHGAREATQDAEHAAQAGEEALEASEQSTQAAGQATQASGQDPAAAAGPAPSQDAVTDPLASAAVGQEALPSGAEEQPPEALAAVQETAAEPKQEKGGRSRKRQRPVEGLEDDEEGERAEAMGADAAAGDRDHEEAAEGDTQSGSVESDPALKGGPSKRGKTAGRKRLHKAGAEPSPAKPQLPAKVADLASEGVEHEASRRAKPAAKQQRPEAAVVGPPDAPADPSHQPAPQDSRQGAARQRSDEGLQPGKPAEMPLPGAGGTSRERLAGDVAQRNERLASGLEQVTKIFKQAQQQASEALTQMAADISHLDSLTMTEELLQQTAIGRTMRALAKPMRPLQSLVEVERKAAAVVSRWMKTFQSNKPPGTPAAAPPAGGKAPQGPAHPPSADQPAKPAVQTPPAASQPGAPAPPVAPAGTTAPAPAADAKPAVQRQAQQHAGPQPIAPATASENAAKAPAQHSSDAAAPPAAQPDEVMKKEQMREEARTILEAAFMPRGTVVPPKMAAGYLESAVFEHCEENDLGSGKKYLRQLHLLWNWLAPEGESYQPGLGTLVASGDLHPADLATMSEEQLAELCDNLPSEHLQDAAETAGLPGSEHPAYGDFEIPS